MHPFHSSLASAFQELHHTAFGNSSEAALHSPIDTSKEMETLGSGLHLPFEPRPGRCLYLDKLVLLLHYFVDRYGIVPVAAAVVVAETVELAVAVVVAGGAVAFDEADGNSAVAAHFVLHSS